MKYIDETKKIKKNKIGIKINSAVYLSFLIFALISCKPKESMKDYINRGFAKPQIERDARFTVQNVGDGGKVYVPSEQEIEVECSIKNKYSQELTGEIDLPEEKKAWFNKTPVIKELTPDKMVIAFSFKSEAEPSSNNSFLGESVELVLKIFEKKTGRSLSSQNLVATCNTPPQHIDSKNIVYKEENDEYEVVLPKNEGKHQDLRSVQFSLSSEYGDEVVEPKMVSIREEGEQGRVMTLKIKGEEGWQLKSPSGQRDLKAIVYDIAGLRSVEGKNKTQRIFTSITLLPSTQNVSIAKAENEGIPVPRIKELEEFFRGNGGESEAGYVVSYSVAEGLDYDAENKVFKKKREAGTGAYEIFITLDQGNGNIVKATYTINVFGKDAAEIDTSSFAIQDVSTYPEGTAPVQIDAGNVSFTDVEGVQKAFVDVPYTGSDTRLRVHVEAVAPTCKCEDEGGTSWGEGVYKKDYEVTLPADADGEVKVALTIISEDGSVKKKYEITFRRAKSLMVAVLFVGETLSDGSKAVVKASWKDGAAEASYEKGVSERGVKFTVARGVSVNFVVSVTEGVKVKSLTSSDALHSISGVGEDGGSFSLVANGSFALTVVLGPDVELENEAELDKSKLKIEDVSTYAGGASPLQIDASKVNFVESREGQQAVVEVPYTGSATKLKVTVVSKSTKSKCEDADGKSWGEGVVSKEYEVTLPKESDGTSSISLAIVSEDGSVKKRYEIVFKRAKSSTVEVVFVDTDVLTGGKAEVKASWKYGVSELQFEKGARDGSVKFIVAKGETVTVEVSVGAQVEIQSVTSSDASHNMPSGFEKGGRISLLANENFVLTLTLMRESTAKVQARWDDYLVPATTCGYTYGTITYYKDWEEKTDRFIAPNVQRAVQKDKPVKFKAMPLAPYEVAYWLVNGVKVESSDASYTLSGDKAELTIKAVTVDIVVKVVTIDTANPRIDDEKFKITDETSPSQSVNKVKLEGFKPTVTGNTGSLAVTVPYTGANTVLRLHIEAAMGCKGEDNGSTADWSDGETKREANVDLNETPGSSRNFIFKIKSKNGSTVTYTITFTRAQKKTVDVQFVANDGVDPASRITIKDIKWEYKKADSGKTVEWKRPEADSSLAPAVPPSSATQKRIVVSDGSKVEFTIGVQGEIEIESCMQGTTQISTVGKEGGKVTLPDVTTDMVITVHARPKGAVYMTWDPFSTTNSGYTGGKRSYIKPTGEHITDDAVPAPDPVTHKRKWPVKKGTDVSFAVTLAKNGDNVETHEVTKWVVKKKNGGTYDVPATSTDGKFVLENNNTKLTIKDAEEDYTVQVVLKKKPTVHVKLRRISDAETGEIEVYENILDITTVGGGQPDEKDIFLSSSTANSVNIKVNGLDPKDKVVAVKHTNALGAEQDTTGLFDDKGFFTGTSAFTRMFNAGDTFEVTVARMQEFFFSVTDIGNPNTNTHTSHKLVIKKSASDNDPNHVFLPKNGITVNSSTGDADRKVYFTKDTKLDYKMEELDSNYEIREWRKDHNLFKKNDFHINPDDDVERVGKDSVENVVCTPESNYMAANLYAVTAKKGHLVKIYLQDFTQDGSNDVLGTDTDDRNLKVKIEVKRGNGNWEEYQTLSREGEKKAKIKGLNEDKFRITAENGGKFYFARYKSNEYSFPDKDPYRLGLPEQTIDKNGSIFVQYTDYLIVCVHPVATNDKHNFPAGFFDPDSSGKAPVEFMRLDVQADYENTGNFHAIGSPLEGISGFLGPGASLRKFDQVEISSIDNSVAPHHRRLQSVWLETYSSDTSKLNLNHGGNDKIRFRYSFGDIDNMHETQASDVNNSYGRLFIQIKDNVQRCGVLHLQPFKLTQ